jgi:hypothetical protein
MSLDHSSLCNVGSYRNIQGVGNGKKESETLMSSVSEMRSGRYNMFEAIVAMTWNSAYLGSFDSFTAMVSSFEGNVCEFAANLF